MSDENFYHRGRMTADELIYSEAEKLRRMMDPLDIYDKMNVDRMHDSIFLSTNESMQNVNNVGRETANYSALEAIRNEQQMIEGCGREIIEESSKLISGLEVSKGIASLKDGLGQSLFAGLAQDMSYAAGPFVASSMGCEAKGLMEYTLDEYSKKWADFVPKIMEIQPIPEPTMVMPVEIESEPLDISLLTPITREVTLSDETIEKLAEKLAEKGSKVIVIAKNKGVAIMGNSLSDMIHTGDINSNESAE